MIFPYLIIIIWKREGIQSLITNSIIMNFGKLKEIEINNNLIIRTTNQTLYIDTENKKFEIPKDINLKSFYNQNIKNIKVGRLKNININRDANDWTWRNLDINNGIADALSIIFNSKTLTLYIQRTNISCDFESNEL